MRKYKSSEIAGLGKIAALENMAALEKKEFKKCKQFGSKTVIIYCFLTLMGPTVLSKNVNKICFDDYTHTVH